ncbi:CaiB/BaiF CoA-transferase family protein [Acidisphaera sp. L21]|uniref:CaiB/BaiF CoA transferase family protein n=1 Tax=Acidisphaera sp. L21 TaxID=1641851 RepID=UPI00131C9B51|nr:CoA transferase [Acidisphaera sp. L21]
MASPLSQIKVVEISVAMAGPFCGMMLADFGADVVKVERVGHGDDSRAWPPYFHGEMSHYYASANRNKRSIALDLKDPEAVAVARRLIEDADVLIDNYRYGALARAGLDYASLSAANPRLIYCSISGFGASGPRRDDPANDLFMQAFSGGMSITGEPDGGPMKMGLSVADIGAGLMGTIGVMMAIEARHATGRGQRVDTSLLEGQMSMLSYHLCRYFATGLVPGPSGSGSVTQVPYQAFKAADDWIVIAAFNQRMWGGFCVAVGHAEWERDPRFTNANTRSKHRDELLVLIRETLAQQPAQVWIGHLDAAGVPCTRVNRIDQVVAEEQVAAREMIVELDVPELGRIKVAGLPVKLSDTPGRVDRHPPHLGEHTREVLQALGYDERRVAELGARGAVGLHVSHTNAA